MASTIDNPTAEKYVVEVLNKFKSLERSASLRDDWINRISHYAVPTLYNFKYDQTDQRSNLPDDVYDSSMVQASNTFASGMYSFLTNPSSKWMTLVLRNREQMNAPGVRDWLEEVERIVYQTALSSNFYPALHLSYRSLTFGNCVIFRERDALDILRYYPLALTDCYFEYDAKRRINSMYRKIRRTPIQLIEEYGNLVPESIRQKAKDGQYNKHEIVIHCVRPRWQRDPQKNDSLNKKYESVYILQEGAIKLKESGFDKFPFFVGHFIQDPVSPYSYGPGHLSLYDVKSLNQFMLTTIRSSQKLADPVVSIPHDGYVLPYVQDPGAVNIRLSEDPNDVAKIVAGGGNLQPAFQLIEDAGGGR